jgi:hypothetical protein
VRAGAAAAAAGWLAYESPDVFPRIEGEGGSDDKGTLFLLRFW